METLSKDRVLYYNKKTSEIIMPNEFGVMDKPAPTGEGWLWVRWPVNPHFTGEFGIVEMMRDNYFIKPETKEKPCQTNQE